ncbi:MAG: hypothetical protein COZ46_03010 [Verrucomicrobia bacterium CG_4_10_14_3_um_filter_43_23]|nr:MAG: hypothetical protein AUJ82_00435 [Verrucomicrobia bacterium CG1_02_43_26]PIP59259.1 MAG: hypothetical protein COX01_04500 [Verrucomicrobia bacterium CG22_combo_CG10-13_8_21_14_all_43_17]PIX58557.1 MAG: hypothetical protein COZ46_03010 [Verrucomicrobia bacterium CG_4_10_14_3_um_filter_43_23]PIY61009.1 MAG: hypothetical protein COY94_07330 [Verrucomicrobia bacterium CG_4_10_14_0_8_um_filter_43_34]PJA43850.1 MAG: hypothetical protein CO175_05700 [Verrucomicrobia bacterium CG_4_9_14_3_um_fi
MNLLFKKALPVNSFLNIAIVASLVVYALVYFFLSGSINAPYFPSFQTGHFQVNSLPEASDFIAFELYNTEPLFLPSEWSANSNIRNQNYTTEQLALLSAYAPKTLEVNVPSTTFLPSRFAKTRAYSVLFTSPFNLYKQDKAPSLNRLPNKVYLKQENFNGASPSTLIDFEASSNTSQAIWYPVSFALQVQDSLPIGKPQLLNSSGNLDIDQELLSRLEGYINRQNLEDGYYCMTWSH